MNFPFKSILLSIAVLLLAVSAHGQSDRIGIYADESANGCNLADVGTEYHQLYVIFAGTSRLTALEFQLVPVEGAGLNFMGQAIPDWAAGAMGRADTGVAIALGKCVDKESVVLMTVTYLGLGVSDLCSQLRIRPVEFVNGDKIQFVDCRSNRVWADPGHLTINPDAGCECEVDPLDQPSPVASTTWGGIKAMYVD